MKKRGRMHDSLNATKELEFWINLLANMPDSLSHQVRHFLSEHLEEELECEGFEDYIHYREFLPSEIELGRLLSEYFENSYNGVLSELSDFIKEWIC
jgi:hypothetical protein